MLFHRTLSVIFSPVKVLFANSLKTQYSSKVLNASLRFLACKTPYHKICWTIMNFRSFGVSTHLKVKMVTLTFVKHDGSKLKKMVKVGEPINSIFDPEGDEIPNFGACLGHQECATCHILFPRDLVDKLEEPSDEELDTVCYANEYDVVLSRLGCCVNVTEDMDGSVLIVPEIKGDKRDQD